MIAVPIKYSASYFANFSDIQPSAETIPTFLKMFTDIGLLPTTFTEIRFPTVSANLSPIPSPSARLRLASPDNIWLIDFDTVRVSITKSLTKSFKQELGTPEDFVANAIDFLSRIITEFPKKGSRLSLVTEGFLDEMTPDRLQKAYTLITVPFDFYAANKPVNWNSRSVARINVNLCDNDETINIINQIGRVRGQMPLESGVISYDRIYANLDINTYQGQTETRFDLKSLTPFFGMALSVRNNLVSQIKERLRELYES